MCARGGVLRDGVVGPRRVEDRGASRARLRECARAARACAAPRADPECALVCCRERGRGGRRGRRGGREGGREGEGDRERGMGPPPHVFLFMRVCVRERKSACGARAPLRADPLHPAIRGASACVRVRACACVSVCVCVCLSD